MATVRYVDPVNGPYLTIQAAHDAANEGDTILIAPGLYTAADSLLTLTKRIHIKGNATDPSQVVLSSATGPAIRLNYPLLHAMWIEGVTLQVQNWGSVFYASIMVVSSMAEAGLLHVNRCRLVHPAPPLGSIFYITSTNVACRARLEQCAIVGSPKTYSYSNAASRLEIIACTSPSSMVNAPIAYPPGVLGPNDWVIGPLAGYGADYGAWFYEQWMGDAFAIPGQVILPPGHDRSQSDIRLFRESAVGKIEIYPWMQRTPDPVSGEYSFDYLPTDHRYWVQTVPPPGFQPRIDGPYVPQAA